MNCLIKTDRGLCHRDFDFELAGSKDIQTEELIRFGSNHATWGTIVTTTTLTHDWEALQFGLKHVK